MKKGSFHIRLLMSLLSTFFINFSFTYANDTSFINTELETVSQAMLKNQQFNGLDSTIALIDKRMPTPQNVEFLEKILLDGITQSKKNKSLGEYGKPLFDELVILLQKWANDLNITGTKDSLRRVEEAQKQQKPQKPKIFMHVGLGKKSSIYLQDCLNFLEQKSQLKQNCYPMMGYSMFLEMGAGNAAQIMRHLLPNFEPEFSREMLFQEINHVLDKVSDPSKNILFSSEYLYAASDDRALIMRNYLIDKGYDVELIVVVQPIQEIQFTNYIHYVIAKGLSCSFSEWISCDELMNCVRGIMAYNLPVHIIKYDKDNLLKDILRHVGEDVSLEEKCSKVVINRSLSQYELNLFQNVNSIFKNKILTYKIYMELTHRYNNIVPAKITKEENLINKENFSDISFLRDPSQRETEKKINECLQFDESIEVAEALDSTMIDYKSLDIVINTIKNHLKEDVDAMVVVTSMKDQSEDVSLWLLKELSKDLFTVDLVTKYINWKNSISE